MSGLLAEVGIAYHLNIKMFNKLQHSITGCREGNLILKILIDQSVHFLLKKRVIILALIQMMM
jgi:glucosamine-6-phosphate deaminase